MRFSITFAALILIGLSANGQTFVTEHVDAPGTDNDGVWRIGYSTGTFDANQSTIENMPWWGNEGAAQAFATAMDVNSLQFAFQEVTFTTPDYALYSTNATSTGNYGNLDTSTSAIYAISATNVPVPLPILGILPIVGFLRRMRTRQRS